MYDKERDKVEKAERERLKKQREEREKTPNEQLAETVEAKLREDEAELELAEEMPPILTDEAQEASVKAERRKALCRKQAARERREAEEDGKKAVVKEQARTQLALEDVENWLTYAIQQIDADAKKESAGIGGVVVGDGVPVEMPDVPEADALLRRRAKKRGEPVEKRKKKKKKSAKEDL